MGAMTQLVITRGYPGSGKSTWAEEWVRQGDNRVRVNRDDLREMLLSKSGKLSGPEEQLVTTAQKSQVGALLKSGTSVVVDDTNLVLRFAKDWAKTAQRNGADFECVDFKPDLELCVEWADIRAEKGGRSVSEEVIRGIAQRFPYKKWGQVELAEVATPEALEVYVPDTKLRDAWIVDVDGTIAHGTGRSPYDETRVSEDLVDETIRSLVDALSPQNFIVIFSGRTDGCEDDTREWLADNDVAYDYLHMRKTGDSRKDSIVKYEMFNEFARDKFNVRGVLDDRTQVVNMWRELGLKCLQVQPGDF